MSLRILKPGFHTTVQDLGRIGYQQYGIVVSGAMDDYALKLANILLGNNENEAALEITLQGPSIEFAQSTWISICGAEFAVTLDGRRVPMWRPVYVKGGSVLEFGHATLGCRAYLSVLGGIQVPFILESRSTYVRGEIGGLSGRALQQGDVLPIVAQGAASNVSLDAIPFRSTRWYVDPSMRPTYSNHPVLRFIKGQEYDLFQEQSQEALIHCEFTVDTQSDRMGYQLTGELLQLKQPYEMLSEAVTVGTMQIPPSGRPIVLLKDRQTTGGYPRIAQVISVDIPLLAQLKPGNTVRFQEMTQEEAEELFIDREKKLHILRQAILLKQREEGAYDYRSEL